MQTPAPAPVPAQSKPDKNENDEAAYHDPKYRQHAYGVSHNSRLFVGALSGTEPNIPDGMPAMGTKNATMFCS